MCSIKTCFSLAKFIGNQLCQNLFLIKLQPSGLQLIEKETLEIVLFCEFCEIFKNTFFAERLYVTASDIRMQVVVIYNLNLPLQSVTINL